MQTGSYMWFQSLTTGSWRTCKLEAASQVRDDHLSHWTLLTRANNCLIPSQSYACSVLTISRKNVFQNITTSVIPSHLLHDLHYFADFNYTQLPLSLPSHFFPGFLESRSHLSGPLLLIVFCIFLVMLPSFWDQATTIIYHIQEVLHHGFI